MSNDILLETLSRLEAELHHPGVRCSAQRLDELIHPAFHEVGRSGVRYDRATMVDFLLREREPPHVVAGRYRVTPLGKDCALLTYSSAHAGQDGCLKLKAHRVSLWQLTPQGWQLRYHQGTATDEELGLGPDLAA